MNKWKTIILNQIWVFSLYILLLIPRLYLEIINWRFPFGILKLTLKWGNMFAKQWLPNFQEVRRQKHRYLRLPEAFLKIHDFMRRTKMKPKCATNVCFLHSTLHVCSSLPCFCFWPIRFEIMNPKAWHSNPFYITTAQIK